MKKSRFSEQQIAFILKQEDDGTTVEEACRKAGMSIQTYYRWRSKFGGLDAVIIPLALSAEPFGTHSPKIQPLFKSEHDPNTEKSAFPAGKFSLTRWFN